jgi:hypothetical protein
MKYVAWGILIFLSLTVIGSFMNFFNDGSKTINNEFNPSVLLKKYEYFKDLSAAIDKKRADIEMYQSEIESMPNDTKEDRQYIEARKSEYIGILTIHNQLCSEYNAAMSKFNYRFTNVGDLPSSNLEPLPREFKPYLLNLNINKKSK